MLLLAGAGASMAAELPSFLRQGDGFCTDEADFDAFAVGHAGGTCHMIASPTRVAVIGGTGGVKSVVRVMSGPDAYQVGWTNGALPIVP